MVCQIVLAILFYDPSHPKEETCISLLLLRDGSSLWGMRVGWGGGDRNRDIGLGGWGGRRC